MGEVIHLFGHVAEQSVKELSKDDVLSTGYPGREVELSKDDVLDGYPGAAEETEEEPEEEYKTPPAA